MNDKEKLVVLSQEIYRLFDGGHPIFGEAFELAREIRDSPEYDEARAALAVETPQGAQGVEGSGRGRVTDV